MTDLQQQQRRGEARTIYETSPIVAAIKKGIEGKLEHPQIAAGLVSEFPAFKIAHDLSNAVEMTTGLEHRLNNAEKASLTDSLTGLPNRRSLDDSLSREMKWIAGKSSADSNLGRLSYILFDVDNFKNINDTYGHDAGDYVLKEIGSLLSAVPDVIKGRLGGEEFVVVARAYAETPRHILAGHAAKGMLTGFSIADKLRAQIESHKFSYAKSGKEIIIPVTASFGVSGYDFGGYDYVSPGETTKSRKSRDDEKDLYKRADDALYYAKKHGKNQVKVYWDAKSSVPADTGNPGFIDRLGLAYDVLRGIRKVR